MSHNMQGNDSKTPINKKDFWNTTWQAVRDAEFLIGSKFSLDAASTLEAKKAHSFISPEMDAFFVSWFDEFRGAVWCNPPFSKKELFLDRAHEQAKKYGMTVVCMVPFEPTTKWWLRHVIERASIVYIPSARYNFIDDETKKEISGCPFSSCFAVFTSLTMPTQYIHFTKGIGGD